MFSLTFVVGSSCRVNSHYGPDLVALHSDVFVDVSSGRGEIMFGKRPNAPEQLRSLPMKFCAARPRVEITTRF